jgi:hypothetical protein
MDEVYLSQVSDCVKLLDGMFSSKAKLNETWITDKGGEVIYADIDNRKLRQYGQDALRNISVAVQ